jgi:DNA-binding MarR family transcriptional regulator
MSVIGPPTPELKATIDDDVAEFTSLLASTLRDLKRAGPAPAQLREAVESASLGNRHMPALLAVAAAGPITVSDLARRLGLLLSTTSTIVGQLSRAGLLTRTEDDEDRRRTIVQLHEDYRTAMEEWLQIAMAPVRETLQRLSPQARAHFMQGWRILHEEASAAACSDHAGDCEP